ncbi:MAG: hypothetical protein IJY93_04830 [Clostridia bacterium]|nr:hypothetical protein [Clostridia bacterium]
MRRVLFIFAAVMIIFTACGIDRTTDRLEYQDNKLYIEADFTLDDEHFPITMTLEAAEYDEEGRMYARDAVLSIGENSIISGVSFEYKSGKVYISSGDLKIPMEDEAMISGVGDIISLFCISEDYYYSSEKLTVDKLKCENLVFIDGDNRVEVLVDLSCDLPKSIVATVGERHIAADISYIKAETTTE